MAATAALPAPSIPSAAIQARNALSRAESSAANGTGGTGGWYTGTGRDEEATEGGKVKGKLKAKIVAILLLLLSGGSLAFLGSSNSLLGPAVEELFTEATDTQYGSASARFRYLTIFGVKNADGQLNGIFSGIKKYGKMSTRFKNRLAKQGFEITGPKGNQYIRYTNPKTGAITDINDMIQFKNLYNSDVDLRQSYNIASRGRVATFFDNIADNIYRKTLYQSRNIWADYKQTGNAEADETSFRHTMMDRFGDADATMGSAHMFQDSEDEGDGIKNDGSDSSKNADGTTPTERSKNFLDSVANKIASVSQIAETACAVLKFGNLVSVTVAANEIYQSISYFMGLSENISKMKSGQGDMSAINETLNLFSTSQTTDYNDLTSDAAVTKGANMLLNNNTNDISGGETIKLVGSPLMSTGMQYILGGAPASATSTNKFSLGRINSSIAKIMAVTGTAAVFNKSKNTACSLASAANAAVSLVVSITPAGVVKTIGDVVFGFVVSVGTQLAITALVGFLVPVVAQALFTNVFETATGIVAGELFTRGASAANTRIGRSGSGQSLSNEAAAIAYNQVTQTQIALDAEVDRQTHSPFDISNKNTFFGSIAYSLLPTLTSTNTANLASFIRTTARSVSSIISPVKAEGIGSTYMTTFNPNCEELEEIGAKGDLYCNPITTTDVTLIEMSPNDPTYQQLIRDATTCDEEGNCTVNEKSDLAYYISYCANRDSPFGVIDTSILADFEASTGLSWLDSILNALPIIGDLIALHDANADLENEEWANGQYCVNDPDKNSKWGTIKYYQRYIEDMRILEDMGAFTGTNGDENPVTGYMNKYREEHPIDNSTAGIIAHYTGMTKDDAEFMLAVIDYYQVLDKYDSSSRIAIHQELTFNQSGSQISTNLAAKRLLFKNNTYLKEQIATVDKQSVIYYDIRNRSYAA